MSKVRAICISEKKGTAKVQVPKAYFIEDFGIKGDAHAGKWHRQVSLLAFEKIEDFRADGGTSYRTKNKNRRCSFRSNTNRQKVS